MKLNIGYILSFLVLLIIEIIIALYIKDAIVRPYVGDILVIILMYALIKGFIKISTKMLPLYLFIFASTVELAQYFHIVDMLNLQNSKVISIIIGNSFDIKDILCYLFGTLILIGWERWKG